MTILEVEKLKVSYSNHTAIENINFKIEDGEYVCLVGENGSGKSTLVKTIVGLLKPDEGQVNLNISLDVEENGKDAIGGIETKGKMRLLL